MTYRKITVAGKEYEYVVGKAALKIKEVGVFPIEQIGNKMIDPITLKEKFVVTPKTVQRVIEGDTTPNPDFCSTHGLTTSLTSDPYAAEIHNTHEEIHACTKCVQELAYEI
jgi:hypothetical protein